MEREPTGGRGEGYRAHLDGLRAVAVYLVVCFHAGVDRFSGGFVGVDVFFVLSGYLVTQLLVRDLEAAGTISFARFYARRARRLLPAAWLALVATGAVWAAVASPAEIVGSVDSFRAAFLYVANWHFIDQAQDYWAADVDQNILVHFWSLAVEEQFYLLWPLLLGGLFAVTRRAGRRQRNIMRIAVATGAVVSAVAALRIADSDVTRAYYGTDTRAYQLLVGAFVALTPALTRFGPRAARVLGGAGVLAAAALIGIATSALDVGPITRGLLVTATTAVLIVAIENRSVGVVARALSLPPVVHLGRVSYGTYLWHWPVIIVVGREYELSPLTMTAVTAVLATALASLSFQLVEFPVRASRLLDRHRRPVVAVGLAGSILGALVVVPSVVDDRGRPVELVGTGSTSGATELPEGTDWRAVLLDRPEFSSCTDHPADACVVVRGDGPHVLLLGDSHANMLRPAFETIARRAGFTLSVATARACPWQHGLHYGRGVSDCEREQRGWYEHVIPDLDPDVVVVMHRSIDNPANPSTVGTGDTIVALGDPQHTRMLEDFSRRTVEELDAAGRQVVVIEPIPSPPVEFDPVLCLAQFPVDACRYVVDAAPTPIEEVYRSLGEDDAITALDIDRLICPYLPICDPVIDGMIVKRDTQHITATYARSLADEIEAALVASGVIGG